MKTRFRAAPTFSIVIGVIRIFIAFVAAIGKSKPIIVFIGVLAIFLVAAFITWATSEIIFEDDKIIRRIFFIYDRKYPLSAVMKVRLNDDEDSFGGRSRYVAIEFDNERTFILQGFVRSDLKEIIQRIRSVNSSTINSSIDRYIELATKEPKMVWGGRRRCGTFGAV